MKLYAIKPLKWKPANLFDGPAEWWFNAIMPFWSMSVRFDENENCWRFWWYFEEAKDEGRSQKKFKDARSAKLAAEAFYQNKLKKALTSKQEN